MKIIAFLVLFVYLSVSTGNLQETKKVGQSIKWSGFIPVLPAPAFLKTRGIFMYKEKRCSHCHQVKPLKDFHRSRNCSDGRHHACAACCLLRHKKYNARPEVKKRRKEYIRIYYKKNKDILKRKMKKYSQTLKARISHNTSTRKYELNNPEKRKAYSKIRWRVGNKQLIKATACERCGVIPDIIHSHHPDYQKPLLVAWVCPQCHKDIHKEIDNERS